MLRWLKFSLYPAFLLPLILSNALAQSLDAPSSKTLRAVRSQEAPVIDGKLDDSVWKTPPAFSSFTQQEPQEGAAASEVTTVRFLFDDEALYVGVVAFDRAPEGIIARFSRRDVRSNSDRISVDIDPRHDHQSGFWFGVNAAGVLDDGLLFNDTRSDFNWNGDWTVKTALLPNGWSAEFRIPYTVLGVTPQDSFTWGINLIREIGRKNEKVYWRTIPKTEYGWVSLMVDLVGSPTLPPPPPSAPAVVQTGQVPVANAGQAAQAGQPSGSKTLRAVRAGVAPVIDGTLDDVAWVSAPAFNGFTQREPLEGAAASESTTVRFLYDDDALYIGIMAYDSEPEKIIARLTRRDVRSNSDRISVDMDPHHDHQTGYWFGVNAAGVLDDGLLFNDTDYDFTWDGVWTAKTAILTNGWSVEYKIPYHVLRFSPKESYTWGINLIRDIGRKNEKDFWVLVPGNETGWISRMAHLEGIEGIHPPRAFEFTPYGITRSTLEPAGPANPDGKAYFANGGADLRLGVTSNLSLNVAVNPDFGQVEADPAVLNLSTSETFYDERRPFFVEGTGIFKTPLDLFYSRRIGRQPGYFSIPSQASLIEKPEFTTIGAAMKLTGKTEHRTTFGLLNAVMMPEFATLRDSISAPLYRRKIEPLTNALIGRIQQDIGANSNFGLLVTALNRKGGPGAYAGGVDWAIKWKGSAYEFSGQVAGSLVQRPGVDQQGYGSRVKLTKTSGWLIGALNGMVVSPGFNSNDLGYLERPNILNPWGEIGVQKTRPWGPIRKVKVLFNGFSAWNWRYQWSGGAAQMVPLFRGIGTEGEIEWRNFWKTKWSALHLFPAYDDLETRGGPLVGRPPINIFEGGIETNPRNALKAEVKGEYGYHNRGTSWWAAKGKITIRAASNVDFSLEPRFENNTYFAQWITNVDDNNDGIQDHFVFGRLRNHTLDLTTRANITFTRNLSLQMYLQPFVAVGHYTAVHELAQPSTYTFTPYTAPIANPDFNSRSLRSNMVLRWEYRPGSALFLVWSQSRSAQSTVPDFRPFQSIGDSFRDKGTNVLLVKLSYWLNM